MENDVKAHAFWVIPTTDDDFNPMPKLREFAASPTNIDFSCGNHRMILAEASWDENTKCFSGSVFKRRSNNLPSAVDDQNQVASLDLPESNDIGEPMCFVYYPVLSSALIHYSHNGARHKTIASVLAAVGVDTPLTMGPVLSTDAMKWLEDSELSREFEFTIHAPSTIQEIAAENSSIGHGLGIIDLFEAREVTVKATIGKRRSGSLNHSRVKTLIKKLSPFIGSEVTKLKAKVSADEGESFRPINLIEDRIGVKFQVSNANRELNRRQCIEQLKAHFATAVEPVVRAQLHGATDERAD